MSGSSRHPIRGLEILFEDNFLIVVDKSAGLLTESTRKKEIRTAENLLNNYLRKGNVASRKSVSVVHRLDRDTSGVLIFAKSPALREALQETWSDVEKVYMAVIEGVPFRPSGSLTGYLYEDKNLFVHQSQDASQGKFARTDYEILGKHNGRALVRIRLRTGRKNQIRVQFAAMGYPIVGDMKYGNGVRALRMLLHAKSIRFSHPVTRKTMFFETDLPFDVRGFCNDTSYAYE